MIKLKVEVYDKASGQMIAESVVDPRDPVIMHRIVVDEKLYLKQDTSQEELRVKLNQTMEIGFGFTVKVTPFEERHWSDLWREFEDERDKKSIEHSNQNLLTYEK